MQEAKDRSGGMVTYLGIHVSRGIAGEPTLTSEQSSASQPFYCDDAIERALGHCEFETTGEFFYG